MRIFRVCALVVLVATLPAPLLLHAYNPPPGGEEVHALLSAGFLGAGVDVTDTDAVMGNVVNPAVSGFREEGAAALGYAALFGSGGAEGRSPGHVVAGSALLPTRIGVLGGSLAYLDARTADVNLGQMGRARVSYSRDLFPTWSIGAAAQLTAGTQDSFGLGISGDVGLVHAPGDVGPIQDLRWGFVLQSAGIGYRPHGDDADGDQITGFPSIFTPSVGVSLQPWSNDRVSTRLGLWTSTPRFQNLRAGGRLAVSVDEIVSVALATLYDQHQAGRSASERRSLIPSLGIELNITRLIERNRGENRSPSRGTRVVTGIRPVVGDVIAAGAGIEVPFGRIDREGPEIVIDQDETIFISPNNDGASDDIILPISVTDDAPIQSYVLEIENEAGTVVRRIENKDPRPELNFDALVAEIREGETGIQVPESIRWDARDDAGGLVSDGSYRYRLIATDINGNSSTSPAQTVVIDTQPPELTASVAGERIFSPNDDGNQEELVIEQGGSAEASVEGRILDAEGTVVRVFEWTDTAPERIVWDGTDNEGAPAPDGVYRYEVVSADRAGNLSSREIAGIILNRDAQSVFARASAERFRDEMRFALIIPEADGLESWTFAVRDAATGEVRREWSGTSAEPADIIWNGSDADGAARDGRYFGQMRAVYANGGQPEARTREVVRDTQPPAVTVQLAPQPFSPDNDGFEDELILGLEIEDASPIDSWEVEIADPRGGVFRSVSGRGRPSSRLIWDGLSDDGVLVEAATDYPWTLRIADVLGNATTRSGEIPVDVLVIREDGRLKIRISNITFAPNSPALVAEEGEQLSKNLEIINRLAEILERYRTYRVQIEGHAVNLSGTEREEREELEPLSRARAETVRRELVERGLDPDRFVVVGKGGTEPLVPHTDTEERWRNRRVEFILLR